MKFDGYNHIIIVFKTKQKENKINKQNEDKKNNLNETHNFNCVRKKKKSIFFCSRDFVNSKNELKTKQINGIKITILLLLLLNNKQTNTHTH